MPNNNAKFISSTFCLILLLTVRDLYLMNATKKSSTDDTISSGSSPNENGPYSSSSTNNGHDFDERINGDDSNTLHQQEMNRNEQNTGRDDEYHSKDSFKPGKYADYEPKYKSRFSGPRLKFLYCFSCGYKQAFEEFSKIINERYPSIQVEGENHAPLYYKALVAQILTYAKMALIAAIFLGANPFRADSTPSIYQWALDNKLYACMMIFFMSNAVETHLISTGAFEISYNDVPIWSKLEVGRIPSPQELVQIIESHNKLSASSHTEFKYEK